MSWLDTILLNALAQSEGSIQVSLLGGSPVQTTILQLEGAGIIGTGFAGSTVSAFIGGITSAEVSNVAAGNFNPDLQQTIFQCATSTGTLQPINMGSSPVPNVAVLTIADVDGQAATNAIELIGTLEMEDPNNLGNFVAASSVVIDTNWQSVTWFWDTPNQRFKISAVST